MNNARYLDYMMNAREDHLREFYNVTLPDFYKQGMAWVVRKHEIQYLRPAQYNERIAIVSQLAELGTSHLLVELLMFDEALQNLKAILWSQFTCIDVQTGRLKEHTPAFMEFAKTMQVHDIDIAAGIEQRTRQLKTPT